MSTITANTGAVAWNTNGAWVGGIQPTAADDVVIPASAIVTIPTATTALGRSLTVQSSGTIAFATTTSVLTLGDATAGAGNVALSVSSGATVTLTGIGTIKFISTSATVQTIATGGKTMPNFTFNGSTGSWQLTDSSTISNITHLAGTFSTNNQTVSTGRMDAISGSGTLTFGSSAISATFWQVRLFKTITANTATVTLSNASSWFDNNNVAGTNYNGMSVIQSGSGTCVLGPSGGGGSPITLANYTRTGSASKIDALSIGTTSLTCTGTFTANGNSVTNRLIVQSSTLGTARTITAATVSMSNVDFADITGAGAATWSGTSIGNALGNSGITFTTPVTRYCVSTGGAIDLDSTTMWATTSGGASGASVPLCHDDVVFDANSAATNNRLNQTRFCRNLTVTSGFIRSLTATNSTATTIYGDVVFGANMTGLGNSSSGAWQLSGRGAQTIQMNGASFSNTSSSGVVSIITPSGSYSMQDAFSGSSGTLNVQAGTLNTNNYSVTIPSFLANQGALARTVNLGTSIVTVSTWTASGVTLNASSATIVIATASTASRTFGGGGLTYGTLNYTVANSPGTLSFTGGGTIGTLNIGPGRIMKNAANTVLTIGTANISGQNYGYQYLAGLTASNVTVPDSAALSITGDFDYRFRLAADTWATTNLAIAGKETTASTGLSWSLAMNATSKTPILKLSSNGTSSTSATSTAAVPFADGAAGWMRVTWRASDGRVQFFTSTDSTNDPSAVTWTQLGSDRTANVGSVFDSPAVLQLGALNASNSPTFVGKFYRAQFRNNILNDGTGIVCDVDFTTKPFGANTFTESSTNAATVTIGSASWVGDGRVSLVSATASSPSYFEFLGVPPTLDYMVVQDIYSVIPYKMYIGANGILVSGNTNVETGAYPAGQPYSVRQAEVVSPSSATTTTATFAGGGTATAGNMLVAAVGWTANPGTVTTPAGWTLIDTTLNPLSSGWLYTFSKVAVGGETGVTIITTNSAQAYIKVWEDGGFVGTAQIGALDENSTSSSGATSLSTAGANPSNSTILALAHAFYVGSAGMGASVSATNGFKEARAANQSNSLRSLSVPLSATGNVNTTYTWTTTRIASAQLVTVVGTSGNYRFLFFQY